MARWRIFILPVGLLFPDFILNTGFHMQTCLLDLVSENETDYQTMERHFKEEINSLIRKEIGNEIRKIRKRKALSQVELAKKIGVSQQIISRIERGYQNISIITLKKITDALDIKIDLNLVKINKDIDINKPNH